MKAFMDIDVGDQEQQRQRYEKYVQFRSFVVGKALKQLGRQVAEHGDDEKMMESLSEDDVELCASMFEGDPSYSGGEIQKRVPSLRVGRVIIDLDYEKCPRACDNFKCLCTGERGKSKHSGKVLHYKGSSFHRIVKGFVMQGGDYLFNDGRGGETIYGMKFGKDEVAGLKTKHSFGCVAMANAGKPNSSSSQFYFMTCSNDTEGLKKMKKLDGKHVVFGQVVEGLDVLKLIDLRAASEDGVPKIPVCIADCGIL